jgi:uncharacterized damage-inducible protein DinB
MLYLMDQAFEGNVEHSLLGNLRSVQDDDWHWVPPDGGRSIFDIVQHVGEARFAYDDHAFRTATMRWDQPGTIPSIDKDAGPAAIIEWLKEGNRLLRESVEVLGDDEELLKKRKANWGEEFETRWLINVTIQHDIYHAGEINHLRCLRQGTDRWPWDQG